MVIEPSSSHAKKGYTTFGYRSRRSHRSCASLVRRSTKNAGDALPVTARPLNSAPCGDLSPFVPRIREMLLLESLIAISGGIRKRYVMNNQDELSERGYYFRGVAAIPRAARRTWMTKLSHDDEETRDRQREER
jgi:hypothetical protein